MFDLLAGTFISENQDLITALGVIAGALVVVALLDRALRRWARLLTERMTGGSEFSRATTTRLTFARRLIDAAIIGIAVAIALAEFDVLGGLGTAILTSSAITAAVLGFAARQTIANAIAGLMIAVAQPVRIGDLVTVEGQTGTVEDVGLIYTWLRTGSDARVLVPNERLASAVVRNDTIRSPLIAAEATIWLGTDADTEAALTTLAADGQQARVSGMTADGIELLLIGEAVPPAERLAREGDMRARALATLRAAGVR